MCHGNHWLSPCDMFKKETVENRKRIVGKNGLYHNSFLQGHIAKTCPKENFCKVLCCQEKHSTFLHPVVENFAVESSSLHKASDGTIKGPKTIINNNG